MVRISVDLPDEVAERLRRVAEDHATTAEAVAADAILGALEEEDAELEAALAEAEADVAAGRVVPAEDVFAEVRAIIEAAKARKGE